MKHILLLSLLLSIALSCRERLPETPGLEKATQERNSKPTVSVPPAVSEESLRTLLTGGTRTHADNFDRNTLGPKWIARSNGWSIVDGQVSNTSARNKGLWLTQPLPAGKVRIEFDATSKPFDRKDRSGKTVTQFPGDIKCEAFSKTSKHQGGYIFIFGGWGNTVNRIARIEEHGDGPGARVQDGPRHPVKPGHTYRMRVVRDGDTIAWFADEQLLTQFTDPEFIDGQHFGFNNWEAHVSFDNLAIFSLEETPEKEEATPMRRRKGTHKTTIPGLVPQAKPTPPTPNNP